MPFHGSFFFHEMVSGLYAGIELSIYLLRGLIGSSMMVTMVNGGGRGQFVVVTVVVQAMATINAQIPSTRISSTKHHMKVQDGHDEDQEVV